MRAPEICEYCGKRGAKFHDDYRVHLHPECYEMWNAERLAAAEDSREGAL